MIIESSYQQRPLWYPSQHLETIVPNVLRPIGPRPYFRERVNTPDGDFLDLDWLQQSSPKLLIITHGLEGNSHRSYVRGMARLFYRRGWNVLAWNCRSCSGEMNRQPRLYHHADAEDLAFVVDHALTKGYEQVVLQGYSMGGSMALKYLGTRGAAVPRPVKGAATFSVPLDLEDCATQLHGPGNGFYAKRFLSLMQEKARQKHRQFPDLIKWDEAWPTHHFTGYITHFTAPVHGYKDAADFYQQGSALNYLEGITVPALIVNALSDPMLGPACYPQEKIAPLERVAFEMPRHGGHGGFALPLRLHNWAEYRTLQFAESVIAGGKGW